MSRLGLEARHFCRQPVDLLLRPDDVAEVHVVASVEALVRPRGPRQEGGSRRGGSGRGGGGDRQQRGADGGGLSRPLQLLDFFLESALTSFQVTDLHLGEDKDADMRSTLTF